MKKLRCWPGCLAEIVASSAGNEGKIVRVLHFVGTKSGWVGDDRWAVESLSGPLAVVEGHANRPRPDCVALTVQDHRLRPITPPPGSVTDEEVKELFAPSLPVKEQA